jgi:hypothetical protein
MASLIARLIEQDQVRSTSPHGRLIASQMAG